MLAQLVELFIIL